MRKIDKIIIHCTATPISQDWPISRVRSLHVNERGWSDVGYHFLIRKNGVVENGRPVARPGAHVRGHNAHSIGVCYEGGLNEQMQPEDTRTDKQRLALIRLVYDLSVRFPGATVHGHNEFANKACPCFDVQHEFSNRLDLDVFRPTERPMHAGEGMVDPVRETAAKPSAVVKIATTVATTAAAPASTAIFGDWRTAAVMAAFILVVIALVALVPDLRKSVLRKLGVAR